ncbi:MAG TPA: hypothetical protein PLB91_06565 [Spirochaetales bacterium]|nr:hypothetical protein [Spirochaetales bacterium]HRY55641.1 hypothetical protein [Spirochaetia bacterium]
MDPVLKRTRPAAAGPSAAIRAARIATVLGLALGAAGIGRASAQSVLDAPSPAPRPAPAALPGAEAAPAPSAPAAQAAEGGEAAVPSSFRGIELGMERDEVIAALKKDPVYAFRGPEDVSLLPSPNQSLIDVSGLSFVKRAFFQFYEGKLWAIIVQLNPDKIDHYSVYTSLSAKYGEPGLLDPKESRWEDGSTRLSLERPLSLRYLDMKAYAKLRELSAARESADELDRKDFLGGL